MQREFALSTIAASQNVNDPSLIRSIPIFEFVIPWNCTASPTKVRVSTPPNPLTLVGEAAFGLSGERSLARRVNKKQGKTMDLLIKSTALEKKHLHQVSSFDESLENTSPRAARLITTPDSYTHLCI